LEDLEQTFEYLALANMVEYKSLLHLSNRTLNCIRNLLCEDAADSCLPTGLLRGVRRRGRVSELDRNNES
jgi:hypothetical protein